MERFERDPKRLRVLTYHRVADLDDDPDLEPGLISATPAAFRAEMELLVTRYAPISLAQLLDAHAGRVELPEKAVLVTFDDAYRDFAENAWPVLRDLGIPVALFVPTAYPDGEPRGFWWDRLYAALRRNSTGSLEVPPLGQLSIRTPAEQRKAYRLLRTHVKSMSHGVAMEWVDGLVGRLADVPDLNRVLDWNALKTLAAQGVSVCPHGHSHALLTRLSAVELLRELTVSKERMEVELGDLALASVLAYPSNAVNAEVRDAARRSGYVLAFGGRRGFDRLPLREPQSLRRLPVLRYEMGLFRAQLRPSLSMVADVLTAMRGRLRA